MEFSASAPNTCGELVQGLIGGVLSHITCPIAVSSTASIALLPRRHAEPCLDLERSEGGRSSETSASQNSQKAFQAVAATLQWLHRHKPAASRFLGDHPQWSTPQVQNPLPPGKGFGTSTADIAATAAATALACGATLAPENIAAIALQIEPTDGLMFPGIVRFDHLCGKVVEPLGQPPPLDIVVLDFGGCVDTVAFNARLRRAQLEPTAPDVQRAYELVRRGIANSDPALIGEGATLSALAHQSILPKPQLPRVLDFSRAVGALGVNVAHSGAVIGILLDGRHPRADIVLAEARAAFPALESSFATCLVSGGVRGIPTTVPDSPRNSLPRLP